MPASVKRNNFGHLARVLESRVAAVQEATADDAIAAMRADMSRPKHGTHWPGQPTTSSAPGESPAIQTQRLADDLHSVPVGHGDRAIASNVPYAAELEFGSQDATKAPRPFMAPALKKVQPKHLKRLQKLLLEVARGR